MKIVEKKKEEELVKSGDVMHITNTEDFNESVSDYVMLVVIKADTFNLISLSDGNRYFGEKTIDEFPKDGMKPSELIDIFTSNSYALKKVEAVFEVYSE